uniref:Neutral ceramidase n=1 Tax=Culicoides sonorensis TaxID=179676 RepID=A0A336ML87_CULSO
MKRVTDLVCIRNSLDLIEMKIFVFLFFFISSLNIIKSYIIGVGIADCTGDAVEVTFMGYAELNQQGQGIHLRQFARTFIVQDPATNDRVVFVSVDTGMIGHAIKREVVKKLQSKFGNIYRMENIVLSGTHTHSAPGGFLTYLLYDLPSLGFVRETFNALINGICESISRAHSQMVQGKIFIAETEVENANINRSPSAYDNNNKKERTLYTHNVDKKLVQLRFEDLDGKNIGAFNWFAVHPVSMNKTNRLISSDNVGYASILLEKDQNPESLIGKGTFVGAFASTNLGDVSPNIKGAKCQNTGKSCNTVTSKCAMNEGLCFASGPGRDMFESTKIIATNLYLAAANLLKNVKGRQITGPLQFILQNINMTSEMGQFKNPITNSTIKYKGCFPAVGYSFAAGTTDGPGSFLFEQSSRTSNPLWDLVRDFIAEPTEEDKLCHKPKPILLMTGRANFPYDWTPIIVPLQLIRIGQVILSAVPGEFSTMSGRRLRAHIREIARQEENSNFDVIIAGLSNLYTSYIVTPEEYQMQRYEGASTLYGPHTLTIYLERFGKLAHAMLKRKFVDPGPPQPDLSDRQMSLNPPVLYDGHPKDQDFGYVIQQPQSSYSRESTVVVTFISGNPRNNGMREKSYFTVEQKQPDGLWKVKLTDADWETKFIWQRTNLIMGYSQITFYWEIDKNIKPGTYRIRHFGYYVYILGGKFPYTGQTTTFLIRIK